MEVGSVKNIFIVGLMLILGFGLALAHEITVTGKLEKNVSQPRIVTYAGRESEVKLVCDLGTSFSKSENSTRPQWSFVQSGKVQYEDLASHCIDDDKKAKNATGFDCEIELEEDSSHFILEIKQLKEEEFGDYICHLGDIQKSNVTFSIQEHVTLSRKSAKGKVEHSVTLDEDEILILYCNSTGLKDYHEISWFKDEENITSDLSSSSGLFENFTKTDDLMYQGVAILEHRGDYTCQANLNSTALKQFPSLLSTVNSYPVAFTYFVRVKESDGWKLPLSILAGEVALIGLFTAFLNWKEKRSGDPDGDYADSDDEGDAVPNGQNGVEKNGK